MASGVILWLMFSMVMMSTSGNLEVAVATNDDYITGAFIADGDIQHAQTRRKLIDNISGKNTN